MANGSAKHLINLYHARNASEIAVYEHTRYGHSEAALGRALLEQPQSLRALDALSNPEGCGGFAATDHFGREHFLWVCSLGVKIPQGGRSCQGSFPAGLETPVTRCIDIIINI